MVDHNRIVALKQRRAIFEAHGQTEKVKAVDAEIARMRDGAPVDPEPEPEPTPEVETAEADLSGVEAATAVRRGPGRPRKG